MTEETADQRMRRMAKEYGIPYTPPATAAPAAPAQAQQPAPPTKKPSGGDGIMGLLGGRKQQIDEMERKAVKGYANGGKIKGPGTPTSDSIGGVVKETGEPIAVSNEERIVSNKQEQALMRIAEMLGFESVDAMFESMTGDPVGPTIKGGKLAAATGMSPEDDPVKRGIDVMKSQLAPQQPAPTAQQVYSGFGIGGLSSNYVGNGPTDPDVNGRNAVTQPSGAVQRGITAMQRQLNQNPAPMFADNAKASAAGEAHLKSLYPAGTFDSPAQAQRPSMADGGRGIIAGLDINNPGQKQRNMAAAGESLKEAQLSSPVTGKETITAESAQAAMGGDMKRSGGISGSIDMAGVNGIMARENAIRQSMIDAQAGGSGVLDDGGIAAANAEKTARWRQDDLIAKSARNPAAGQVAGISAQGQNQAASDAIRQGIESGRNSVAMRGQDIAAMRADGTPEDKRLKQAQTQVILGQNESNAQLAALQKKALSGDQQALATLNALRGKGADYKDRYITLPNRKVYNDMGQIVGEEPGGIFDAATGQAVQQAGTKQAGKQAPASAIEYLKKNPTQAAAFKAKYGYLPEGF